MSVTLIPSFSDFYVSNFVKLSSPGNYFLLLNIKGQLQRFYKLVSYERAVKILKNDICATEIGQAVLEIFEFKVKFPRRISKI